MAINLKKTSHRFLQRITKKPRAFVHMLLHSPFAFQGVLLSFLLFFLTGFSPTYIWATDRGFGVEFNDIEGVKDLPISEVGFIDTYMGASTAKLEDVLVENQDGEKVIVRKKKEREKEVMYAVKSGDSIPKIAHSFGLKVRSILWANDLTLADDLPIGKTLKIPPKDGVYYKVQKGDTISEIAKAHGISSDEILATNGLQSSKKLSIGEEVFIPNAQKVFIAQKPEPIVKQTTTKTKTYTTNTKIPTSQSNGKIKPANAGSVGSSISRLGYKILRPSKGTLTQGYHRGHLALDIASSMNTPIYAVAPGTVITSQDGWNGGYGRYIIVDHGGGVHSLYAHNNVRKVKVGDWVEAGELVALMGNTGRVFGRTGIHLHFELRINGRKVNPYNYFR